MAAVPLSQKLEGPREQARVLGRGERSVAPRLFHEFLRHRDASIADSNTRPDEQRAGPGNQLGDRGFAATAE